MEEYYSDLLGGASLFADSPSDASEAAASPSESASSQERSASATNSSDVADDAEKKPKPDESRATWSELSRKVVEAKSTSSASLPFDEKPAPVIPKPAPLTVSIPKPAVETKVEVAETTPQLDEKLDNKLKQSVQEKSHTETAETTTNVVQEAQAQAPAPEVYDIAPAQPEAKKSWTERDVDCLLFKVNGLTLAVPLEMLGSVHKLKEEITPLFGSAPWFMGIFMVGEEKLNLLDTTRWVMPERYNPKAIDNYRFAIRLGKSNWAVACDEIGQAIKVTPKQVKWRTERGKRTWLAGTVIEHMCGLLDAENLLSEMELETKKRKLR